MIAHDLKSPLSLIINIDNLIKDPNTRLIKSCGIKILNMVQNITGLHKFESTNIQLNKSAFNLDIVIEKCLSELSFFIDEKSLELSLHFDQKFLIYADEQLISRVLTNLLTNAIKFSPINEKITIKAKLTENSNLYVAIKNNGPHIPESMHEEIFDLYIQHEKKSLRHSASSGIGLAFAKMVIEAHGGKIGVNSKPDSGTEFWFVLNNISKIKNIPKYKHKIEYHISENNLSYLKTYIKKLKEYKVYELSSIKNVLKEIRIDDPDVRKWKLNIENAVYTGNQDIYLSLLEF